MDQRKTERFILMLIGWGGIGIAAKGALLGWEFWVPPILIIGAVFMWVLHFLDKPDYSVREVAYLIYAMFVLLYFGVQHMSFFDVAIGFILVLVTYSFMNHVYMLNLVLAEYFIVMVIQFYLWFRVEHLGFTTHDVIRTFFHIAMALFIYWCCVKSVNDRLKLLEIDEGKNEIIETYDADMEDFLSNISHELRTPVNVVNGMSDLLIKREGGSEHVAIKKAGIRLAYQIEDIQDYTECKRDKILLEEEDYMTTSLINDVVVAFRLRDIDKDIELVVDLDPKVPTMMRGDIKKLHKVFRHLLENAIKFTRHGGIYVRMYTENMEYGVNLCIEVTDTGIGMDRKTAQSVTKGMYQVNKKRNRSSGGIGLGLYIVYGFTHSMGGFVRIESEKKIGTTIRVTIPQKVVNHSQSISLQASFAGDVLFHVQSGKYSVPRVRDFYRAMAANLARGIKVPLYAAETVKDIEKLKEKLNVTNIFMGQDEYEANREYFDELSNNDIIVAVSAEQGFKPSAGSGVIVMPKPIYAYPVIKILNEGKNAVTIEYADDIVKPVFKNVEALVVDDEPMNLVVASGIFKDYEMKVDTAASGKEAIDKYKHGNYDIVFMDHMMPEMDGVEAMKRIKELAAEDGDTATVVALTANVVSGAREMFINEGFDGFIAKPINTADFERVMLRVLPENKISRGGGRS